MALLNQQTQIAAQIPSILEKLRGGQAPDKFNREFLRDLGLKSSNHIALIPLLKGLGFLGADNVPTDRYRQFLDKTKSGEVIARALKEAYGDIFVLKAKPTKADLPLIQGKFKSTYNLSDTSAERNARTFLALLEMADPDVLYGAASEDDKAKAPTPVLPSQPELPSKHKKTAVGLNYNIEIHLPATKDVEVYNAIFKSLREHLVD
ncbi:DUF5343 domain-containing protein [Bradyrhizobium liaoningense]|uniref:DUF5343 domain-containing protein n=1 Tax=Bradyrhizobium liaoningense TaxID=43992 RepID=UPI001BAD7B4D|nr:DUF5343 domain-containing protein [Bradyrhizobium liaoningense]MBR0986538.1 DUF5343 domain-containing protein [Bradyrhizobium liaoningense]